jgi:hypothetical protein
MVAPGDPVGGPVTGVPTALGSPAEYRNARIARIVSG